MFEGAITIDLASSEEPGDLYRFVHAELGVWPTITTTSRGSPDLVVYVLMTLSAFGGAVLNEVAAQSAHGLVNVLKRLVRSLGVRPGWSARRTTQRGRVRHRHTSRAV